MEVQAKLVANHMRIAYSFPAHRRYFVTGYPSEPLLAEVRPSFYLLPIHLVIYFHEGFVLNDMQAAAQQLHHWREAQPSFLLDTVHHHMKTGLLDRTDRGEVVARMLIIEAYDRAVTEAFTFTMSGSDVAS